MIYTSNYFTVWNHPQAIGISRGQPKTWNGTVDLRLAPATWEMVKMKDWDRFQVLFREQLSKLDVHKIAKEMDGKILLCWENIEKDHCHRELVSEWFIQNGYECKEWPKKERKTKVTKKTSVSAKAKVAAPEQMEMFSDLKPELKINRYDY